MPTRLLLHLQNPPTLQRFQAASVHMANLAGLLLVAPEGLVADEGAPGTVCHCYTLIAMLHIVFGFLLPAIAVHISEQRSRSEYVMFRAAELGVSVVDVGERIGLHPDEGLQVCCFDAWAALVRCVALLPPLSVSTWLVVLTLSTKWCGQGDGAARQPGAIHPTAVEVVGGGDWVVFGS